MTMKLEINNAALTITTKIVDGGEIPTNLAKATYSLLGLHKANGDLAWVRDILAEMENSFYGLDNYNGPNMGDEEVNRNITYDENGAVIQQPQ